MAPSHDPVGQHHASRHPVPRQPGPHRPARHRPARHGSFWFPLLGLGFAVAGADKLLGQPGYRHMFRDWGWSRDARRLLGAGEFAGGVLLASEAARRLGGLVLTTASTSVLTSELQRGETSRAVPRGALLLAAMLAALPARRAR